MIFGMEVTSLKNRKRVLVLIFVIMLLIPAVYGADTLIKTRGRISVRKKGSIASIRVVRRAPFKWVRVRPTSAFYYTLYRKDAYGRYRREETEDYTIRYRMKSKQFHVEWYGSKRILETGLKPGDYKLITKFTYNCHYRELKMVKTFSIG